mgnify:CR=1 FL=1
MPAFLLRDVPSFVSQPTRKISSSLHSLASIGFPKLFSLFLRLDFICQIRISIKQRIAAHRSRTALGSFPCGYMMNNTGLSPAVHPFREFERILTGKRTLIGIQYKGVFRMLRSQYTIRKARLLSTRMKRQMHQNILTCFISRDEAFIFQIRGIAQIGQLLFP